MMAKSRISIFFPALLSCLIPMSSLAQQANSSIPVAQTQERMITPDLSPFMIASGRPVEDGSGGVSASNMVLRTKNLTVSISKFRARPDSEGNWIIQISGASFRKQGDTSGANLTIGPSSFEIGPGPDACEIGRLHAMNISRGEIILPVEKVKRSAIYSIESKSDTISRQSPLKFDGLSGRLAVTDDCIGSMQVKASNLAFGDALGGAIRLSDGSLRFTNIPLSTLSNPGVARSVLTARATNIQYQIGDSLPVWTTGSASISGDANVASLMGFTRVISSLDPFSPGAPATELRIMQFFNASTLLDANLALQVGNVSISAAGAVPAAMVANFSRAGLSVMSGILSANAKFNEGKVDAGFGAKIVGVADVSATVSGSIQPYDQDKFKVALSGTPLGFHLIPSADISRGRISFTDEGFRNAAWAILGVSAPAYLSGLEQALSKDGTSQSSLLATFLNRLEYFLRLDGQDGVGGEGRRPTVTSISPKSPVGIIPILLSALSPDADNVSPLNFKISH